MVPDPSGATKRRRDPTWREAIIQAWDRTNTNTRHPDALATQGRERARIRSERQHRWGHPAPRAA
jgi:hypothetical protein